MSKFIMTFDKETADKLKDLGYKCIDDGTKRWLFLNSMPLNFATSKIDASKVQYTSNICI